MHYLVIDACLNGTGIRDYYNGGYVNACDLPLATDLTDELCRWLEAYAVERDKGYSDPGNIENLDQWGKRIARQVKSELPNAKITYFSDARLTTQLI